VATRLTLVYDHDRAQLTNKMIEIQHAHADRVVPSKDLPL
jgi:metal-responsive CopG/Arc/MetJ family transcriptional regulator